MAAAASRFGVSAKQHLANIFAGDADASFIPYLIQLEPTWVSWISKLTLLAGLVISFAVTRKLPPEHRLWFRLQLVFLITLITALEKYDLRKGMAAMPASCKRCVTLSTSCVWVQDATCWSSS